MLLYQYFIMEEKKKTIDNMTPHITKNKKIDRIVTEKLKNDFESWEKSNAEILNSRTSRSAPAFEDEYGLLVWIGVVSVKNRSGRSSGRSP